MPPGPSKKASSLSSAEKRAAHGGDVEGDSAHRTEATEGVVASCIPSVRRLRRETGGTDRRRSVGKPPQYQPWTPPNGAPGAVVAAHDLTRRYGEGDTAVDALKGVSLDVQRAS